MCSRSPENFEFGYFGRYNKTLNGHSDFYFSSILNGLLGFASGTIKGLRETNLIVSLGACHQVFNELLEKEIFQLGSNLESCKYAKRKTCCFVTF